MKKGISPIISVIILLLIVVAIAGSAYTYIVGYYAGLTAKVIELTSSTCSAGDIRLIVHNMGTDKITASPADWTTSGEVIQGSPLGAIADANITKPTSDIDIDGTGTFTFVCGTGNVCRTRIIVSRSVVEAQVNC